VLPRIVVYDPALTATMPRELSAASGMSALAHGVESLYAPDSTAQSLDVAEEAIGALARGLSRAVSQPSDLKARTETHCEVLGSPVGPWQHHHGTPPQTAHVLGGRYQLPHAAFIVRYCHTWPHSMRPQQEGRSAGQLAPSE